MDLIPRDTWIRYPWRWTRSNVSTPPIQEHSPCPLAPPSARIVVDLRQYVHAYYSHLVSIEERSSARGSTNEK